MNKTDEESEALHRQFLDKEIDLGSFVLKYKKLRTTYHKRALIHLAAKASPTAWPILECIQLQEYWEHLFACLCRRLIQLQEYWKHLFACVCRRLIIWCTFIMFVCHSVILSINSCISYLLLIFGSVVFSAFNFISFNQQ